MCLRRPVRLLFLPAMAALAGVGVALAAAEVPKPLLALVVVGAIALSFGAERAAPYEAAWNESLGDARRDVVHALVNEGALLGSLAVLPVLAERLTLWDRWPASWPFAAQVLAAVLAADLGITLAHMVSHRVGWLWRLHAVHHSVRRFYGLNGLMKHPLHQAVETLAGIVPLLLVGLPPAVASALAVCVALQLLLQHSNVDYATGGADRLLALNRPHRFHHVAAPGEGDVNFGLFTTLWDRALGTHRADPARRFRTEDLGVAGDPDYPTAYLDQLVAPFRR